MISTPPHKESFSGNNDTENGDYRTSQDPSLPESVEESVVEYRDSGDHEAEISHTKSLTMVDQTTQDSLSPVLSNDTEARLDALTKERTALRDEVAQLRRSLEQIQGKHEKDLGTVRALLEETQGEKELAEAQYRGLLGKVNTIRSQLGERLKADAVCIESLAHLPWSSLCRRKTWHRLEIE